MNNMNIFRNILIIVNNSFSDSLSGLPSRPGPVKFALTVILKLKEGRERGREGGREGEKEQGEWRERKQ